MLRFNIDISDLEDLMDMRDVVDTEIRQAAQDLQQMVQAKITEIARQKLKSRYQTYIKALSSEQVNEDTYVITLGAEAMWIEEGMQNFNMLDGLLKSPKAKTAKDGSKFLILPFMHGPGIGEGSEGGESGEAHQDLISEIKAEMRRRRIPFSRIEKNPSGEPIIGKLHSFSVRTPDKSKHAPGQGVGPIGKPRQGGTGTPFLNEVSVYQTKNDKGKVKRSVMTFRVASSKQRGTFLWEHPGNKPAKIMDEALEWAREEWEQSISPEIVANIISKIA